MPGYRLKNGPVFDGNRVSIYLEVEGLGDYLPNYAGNLDIMTAAALRTAEMFAQEIADGAKSGQWAAENRKNGAVFPDAPAAPGADARLPAVESDR